MTQTAEVIVLGLGPGGELTANELLVGGVSVIAIEAELVGGECPYWGCIPSKMALRGATVLQESRRIAGLAGTAEQAPQWAPVALRIREQATDYWNDSQAAARVADKGGILVRGRGVITSPRTVEVDGQTYTATRALVIATGTSAAVPSIEGLSEVKYWTNREAVSTEQVPATLTVLGGGAIGCELAQAFSRFGAAVTILEGADRLIASEEPEASDALAKALTDEEVTIRTGVKAVAVSQEGEDGPITVTLEDGTKVTSDKLLVATGRTIIMADLGVDSLNAGAENGQSTSHAKAVPVDEWQRVLGPDGMPVDGVFAVGDCVAKGAFTHVAVTQGRMVVDQLLGRDTVSFDERTVGHVTFTDPEVGSVGLTEDRARAAGFDVAVAAYPMPKVARAWIHGEGNEGVIKIVVDRKSRTVIGATVVGPHAGEVLSGLTVAVAGKVPIDVLRTTVWAYPTYHRGFDAVLDELPDEFTALR